MGPYFAFSAHSSLLHVNVSMWRSPGHYPQLYAHTCVRAGNAFLSRFIKNIRGGMGEKVWEKREFFCTVLLQKNSKEAKGRQSPMLALVVAVEAQ